MATARSARRQQHAHLIDFGDSRVALERLKNAVRESAYRGRRRAWLVVSEATPPKRDTIRMPAESYGMVRRRAGD